MSNKLDAGRYRQAATLALEQLDHCIKYLHEIGQHRIATQLEKNHAQITKNLQGAGPEAERANRRQGR